MLQNSTIWKVMENKVLVTFTNFQEFLLIVSLVNFSTFKSWKKKKKLWESLYFHNISVLIFVFKKKIGKKNAKRDDYF